MLRRFLAFLVLLTFPGAALAQNPVLDISSTTSQPTSDSGVYIYPHAGITISVLSGCAVSSNTCTNPTVAVGDLAIAVAIDTSAATIPTLPAGWTNLVTSTGNVLGLRAACQVATTTTLTVNTFTNATRLVIMDVPVNQNGATATSNCNTTGVGALIATNGASAATATYSTLPAFTNGDSSSFGLFCVGALSSTAVTPPAGTALISGASAGSAPIMSCFVTSAAINSWASKTGAISPNSTWITVGLELLAAGQIEGRFAAKSLAANTAICAIAYPVRSPTIRAKITDDGGNTWPAPLFDADDGNEHIQIYITTGGLNTSMTKAIFTFNGSTNSQGFYSACDQFENIATTSASDGACGGGAATGATMQCNGSCVTSVIGCNASITTTAAKDLIWGTATNDGATCGGTGAIDLFTAGTAPFALVSADGTTPHVVQAQVQAAAGAITPSMTQTCTDNWFNAYVALKQAVSGSIHSGMYAARVQGIKLESVTLTANKLTMQFPGTGKLPVITWQNQGGFDVTAITSTNPSCTWTQVDSVFGSGSTPANLAGDIQVWYAANCQLTATTQFTATIGSQTSITGSGFDEYDIVGGATVNPVDTAGSNGGGSATYHAGGSSDIAGSQATPATPLAIGTVIQPSTSNGLVISAMQVLSQNVYCFTSPAGILCNPADQNNNWSVYPNPNTNALSYTITTNNAGANGIQNWALRSVAFKAAPATAATMPPAVY